MDGDFNGRYILDEAGNVMPCPSLLEWAAWFETAGEKRRLARDQVGDYTVSTVFLGLDYGMPSQATNDPLHYQPVLWETAVFDLIHGLREVVRYRNREAALAGHAVMIMLYREHVESEQAELRSVMQGGGTGQDDGQSPEGQASSDQVHARRIGPEGGDSETHEREHHEDQS